MAEDNKPNPPFNPPVERQINTPQNNGGAQPDPTKAPTNQVIQDKGREPSTEKTQGTSPAGHTETPGTPNLAPAPEDAPLKDLENSKRPDGEQTKAEAAIPTGNGSNKVWVTVVGGKHRYQDDNGEWQIAKIGDPPFQIDRKDYDNFRGKFNLENGG